MLIHRTWCIDLECFEAWGGAIDTLDILTSEDCNALEAILEDEYPDGIDETTLNDILAFENDWIAEMLGFSCWEDLEFFRENDIKPWDTVYKDEKGRLYTEEELFKVYTNDLDAFCDEFNLNKTKVSNNDYTEEELEELTDGAICLDDLEMYENLDSYAYAWDYSTVSYPV